MDSILAINNEIREVTSKIDNAKFQMEEAKRNIEQQKIELAEVEAEIAEKEKINKIAEYLQTLDISKIKTPTLSNDIDISGAINIILKLYNESRSVNRFVHDSKQKLTQYENDFEKYEKEVKTLTEYLQGLFIQLKFKVENERKMLDQVLQSSQRLASINHLYDNQPNIAQEMIETDN